MKIIEPHIHMYSRTTDDYSEMYRQGIRVTVEPSFWLGATRRYAGTFWDYFQLILDFEGMRAERYGIDHYANISVNPKEAEDLDLANDVLDGIDPYFGHERCLAVGEIGYNLITPNEEKVFMRQLEMAKERNMLVMIHTPHDTPAVSKKDGVIRTIALLKELNYDHDRIIIDHNTEETMDLSRDADVWAGMTVYPYSKLNPVRCIDILKKWGIEKTLVNSSADWGVSDPCTLPKIAGHMADNGFSESQVERLLFQNPFDFYEQSGKFNPRLDLPYVDPSKYQR
ncbi:MAG: TatD family hydrolase [Verrucomicrobia bacterium]|nr:TatD family hydrolase [Verrucomicrobiota bacterium]